ncbi:MAG TPA: hypothetical protein DIV86_02615 [Alphaproteobacteria bacterium]|nr:hypothetical protein [Alphaproteobacteria bacterium]
MKLPFTLSLYLSRYFLFYLLAVMSIFFVLIFFIDSIELLRKISGKNLPIKVIFEMVVLKLPLLLQQIMPFVVLVASSLTFSNFARKSELVVIRAAGVSGLEFLLPVAISAFIFGLLVVILVNPLSSVMIARHKLLEDKYIERKNTNNSSNFEISDSGIWVKQKEIFNKGNIDEDELEKSNDIILHAKYMVKQNLGEKEVIYFTKVMVLVFNPQSEFLYRLDSEVAYLEGSDFRIPNPIITLDNGITKKKPEIFLYTNLLTKDIQEGFPEPEAISFWSLPRYIEKISTSGFSAIAHNLTFHKIFSSPVLYFAMCLIGAVFSLRSARFFNLGFGVAITILVGFVIYFASNLVFSLGLSGTLPTIVAAWVPVLITFLISLFLIIHYEEA